MDLDRGANDLLGQRIQIHLLRPSSLRLTVDMAAA